jgi:hypothetical protein
MREPRQVFPAARPRGVIEGDQEQIPNAFFTVVSCVSAIETELRLSGEEDFWFIVAAMSEDETEIGFEKQPRKRCQAFDARRIRREDPLEGLRRGERRGVIPH